MRRVFVFSGKVSVNVVFKEAMSATLGKLCKDSPLPPPLGEGAVVEAAAPPPPPKGLPPLGTPLWGLRPLAPASVDDIAG